MKTLIEAHKVDGVKVCRSEVEVVCFHCQDPVSEHEQETGTWPDPGNPAEVARAALGGIKEAIKVGREIKEVGKEMNTFLDEEARARVAWRKKQQEVQRRGDMMYIDAINEYRVLYNIRKNKEEAFRQIEKEFGKRAVSEVQDLEVRLRKERKELQKDFTSDREQTRREWLIIGLLGLLIYAVLKITKVW